MERSEFGEWLAYHSQLNPEWLRRMGKIDKTKSDAWARQFIGASLEAAKRATDEMLSGDLKRPFAAEEHIGVIARRARDLTTASIVSAHDDEDHYCLNCEDSLYVSILHPKAIERAQKGEFNAWVDWYNGGQVGKQPHRRGWTSAAVFCHCRRAVEFKKVQQQEAQRLGLSIPPLATYDSREHIKWEVYEKGLSWADLVAKLIDKAIDLKPRNYVKGFDDYNAGR